LKRLDSVELLVFVGEFGLASTELNWVQEHFLEGWDLEHLDFLRSFSDYFGKVESMNLVDYLLVDEVACEEM